jgi:ribosomal protein L40E
MKSKAQSMRELRARWRRDGRCGRCGALNPVKQYCQRCIDYANARTKARKEARQDA